MTSCTVCAPQEELGTPALAFVKSVCHLLALDGSVLDEVLVLRRQLLRLVHCKEFSAASEFKVGGARAGGRAGGRAGKGVVGMHVGPRAGF